MLKRFFRPKWQHADPRVRKQAVLGLSAQDPDQAAVLNRLAADDPEPDVRRAAVKRLSDLAFLRGRAQEDDDAAVREVAAARYRQLLAGGMSGADLGVRLAALEAWPAEDVLAHAARRGREVELRVAALERLQSDLVLQDAAINDPVPRVRQIAAARIGDRAVLEVVLRQADRRDNKLARQLRERLQALDEQQARDRLRQEEQTAVVAELEALAEAPWQDTDTARRMRLENRWSRIQPAASAELAERYREALRRCAEKRAPAPIVERSPAVEPVAAREQLSRKLAALRQAAEPDAAELADLQHQYRRWRQQADAGATADLELLGVYLAAAERWLAGQSQLEELLAAEQPEAAAAQAWLERLDWPRQFPPPRRLQVLEQRLDQARRVLQRREREARLRVLEQRLEAVEQQLEAGHLRNSRRELKRAREQLEQLPTDERRPYEPRLRRLSGQVQELRDWRQFAAEPKQRALCERMEALRDDEMPPPQRLESIKQLQAQWKQTGGSDSAESRALWARFSAAAEAAFDSCRGWLDEQERLKQANLDVHRQLAEQLEQFCTQADWQALELEALERIRGQARREWEAARPVETRADRPLQRRFEARMDQLSAAIKALRQDRRQRKQALIEEVRALLEEPDPPAATAAAKQLQARWREIGSAGGRIDGRLWREFRAGCDALFARRDASRQARAAEDDARAEQAQALLQRARSLPNAPVEALERGLEALERDWRQLDLPRRVRERLQPEFEAVRGRWQRQIVRGYQARQREMEASCAERAELCRRLEAAAQTGAPDAAAADAWRAAAGAAPAGLRERGEEALVRQQGGRGFTADELEAAARRRRELCLRLEILAGVDSPAADQELRMDLQVRRLNEGLAQGSRPAPEAERQELVLQWWAAGPAPVEDELDRRVARALEALAAVD